MGKIYIRDYQSLIELNNSLEYSADSLLKILESVGNYLSGVREVLNRQLSLLEQELKASEEALSEAESSLSSCLASQKWDEDSESYQPSCSDEEGRVSRAREYRDACQVKYDGGRKIVNEFEGEYSRYKEVGGGLCTLPGGEKTLEYLAREHTDAAVDKIHKILEVVEEYINHPMHVSPGSQLPFKPFPDDRQNELVYTPLTAEEKKERFKNGIQKVIAMQKERNYGNNKIADPNRVMICPGCKRPIVTCICTNKREYIRIIHQKDNTR